MTKYTKNIGQDQSFCRGDEINDSFGFFEDRRHKSEKGKSRDTNRLDSCGLFEVKKGQLSRKVERITPSFTTIRKNIISTVVKT